MDSRQRADLDRHITGNYGEDHFKGLHQMDLSDLLADWADPSYFEAISQAILDQIDDLLEDEEPKLKASLSRLREAYRSALALAKEYTSYSYRMSRIAKGEQ